MFHDIECLCGSNEHTPKHIHVHVYSPHTDTGVSNTPRHDVSHTYMYNNAYIYAEDEVSILYIHTLSIPLKYTHINMFTSNTGSINSAAISCRSGNWTTLLSLHTFMLNCDVKLCIIKCLATLL